MDELLKNLISQLSESPTVLSEATTRKIHRLIPVPTDYKIIWADISSFGGYPAGVVITDRALVTKATRNEDKAQKAQIKEKNKTDGKKQKPPKFIYRIVLWEYFSPDEYEVEKREDENGIFRYILKTGTTVIAEFSSKALFKLLQNYKRAVANQQEAVEATFSAINSVNAEGVMFNAAYGADQSKSGHGIYAEEAGVILDVLSGEQSTVVGRDNAKNGPDKIVNSAPIQCKYYKTAYSSVSACFKKNPDTGVKEFRYFDLSGEAMGIEVPADQYSQAIEYMKTRIRDGQVPGVTDPNAAYGIVRKGKLTYNQALNLAKAGTVESITFDAATGAVNCLSAFGISAVVAFAQTYWITKDPKKAAKSALVTGLQVYGLSFISGVLASQISRTGIANVVKPVAAEVSNAIGPKAATEIVNAFRALAGKKAIYGSAAQKSFTKFLGSTAMTQGVMLLVFSVPDTYKALSGKISAAQYFKNMTSLLLSFGGSITFSALGGSAIGKVTGGKVSENVGSGVGMVLGMVGGALFGAGGKAIWNVFYEDDAIITARLFNAVLINEFIDNMLSVEEQDTVILALGEKDKPLRDLQQRLLKSVSQEADVKEFLEPIIQSAISSRQTIGIEAERSIGDSLVEIIQEEEPDDDL